MKTNIIYSENPGKDLWTRLLGYCHDRNLSKAEATHNKPIGAPERKEIIAALKHSSEYFRAGTEASLNTSPVHLYYGMVSLLRATTIIISGVCETIRNHGMTMPQVSNVAVSDLQLDTDGSQHGGLIVYANTMCPKHGLQGGLHWRLKELLGGIPDCYDEHLASYGSATERSCIPIERVITSDGHKVDRISLAECPTAEAELSSVANFRSRYLNPQSSSSHLVLRERLNTIPDISVLSLSGRRFLIRTHQRPASRTAQNLTVTLPEYLCMFMAMFILGNLSRYHPAIWMDFNGNPQEDKALIDLLIAVVIRRFPNLMLDIIEHRQNILTASRRIDTDLRQFTIQGEVKSIVKEQIRDALSHLTKERTQ